MHIDISRLIDAANRAKVNAYAPYTGFRVGAAVCTDKGEIYSGCNVENASLGLTICAERTAIFKAVSHGERNFQAIAVIADGQDYISPCGACRQVIAEFGDDILVFMVNSKNEYQVANIKELLPLSFKFKMDDNNPQKCGGRAEYD